MMKDLEMDAKNPEKLPPDFSAYLKLNAGVYGFLVVMTWLLIQILGSARGLILFAMFLAAGFSIVTVFDYFWLRSRQ